MINGFIGGGGGTYNPGIATPIANEEEQYAQNNNDFWANQYAAFNPQQQFLNTPSTQGAFQNISNTAKGQGAQAASAGVGNSTYSPNQVGSQLDANGNLTSKTLDINTFLKNQQANQGLSNQRLQSMFGGMQNVNNTENELNVQLPQERALSNAENQQEIENMWNKYYQNQPNVGNEIAGAVGNLGGRLAGKGVNSLFGGNNNQTVQVPSNPYPQEFQSYENPPQE